MSEPIHGELLEVLPARSRRRESFDDFYATELPRLVALARGLCGAGLAEDVAQEAMLVAYRRWREVGALENPEQWVRRTCANLAVSQFRRRMVELRVKTRLSIPRPPPEDLDETSRGEYPPGGASRTSAGSHCLRTNGGWHRPTTTPSC